LECQRRQLNSLPTSFLVELRCLICKDWRISSLIDVNSAVQVMCRSAIA